MINIDLDSLKSMKVAELRDIAGKIGIENANSIHKVQLRQLITDTVKAQRAAEEKKAGEEAAAREESEKKEKENERKKEEEAAKKHESKEESRGHESAGHESVHAGRPRQPSRPLRHDSEGRGMQRVQNHSGNRNYRNYESSEHEQKTYHRNGRGEQHYYHRTYGQENRNGAENHPESENGQSAERKYSEEERPQVEGILEIAEGGFGFLRFQNFLTSDRDVYVSQKQIRRFNLKTGDRIKGISRLPNEGERFGALLYVNTVNGDEPGVSMRRPNFEDLTPVFPYERIRLEGDGRDLSMRMIDLFAPVGKGQRGLIVAPPKTGKTVLLKKIAKSIEEHYPEMHVMVLLIDERPEEVTDMKRSINGEVIYSTFDEQAEHHVKVAEMVIAHAHRLAEHKKDVIILLDSITRLARAYNMVIPASGKTLSGGIDPGALHKPKKFFGSARKLEEGGSITILATALIETGSRMDDVIYEEFKGTGNMEVHLDRKLSERRIFPAINVQKSGTRREDLLLDNEERDAVYKIRRALSSQGVQEVTETIIDNIAHTRTNKDFIDIVNKTKVLG